MNQEISRVKAPWALFLKEEASPTSKNRFFHHLHPHRNEDQERRYHRTRGPTKDGQLFAGGRGHKSFWIYMGSGGGDICRLTLVFFYINGWTLTELKNTCKI